jgi:hypothetical protein
MCQLALLRPRRERPKRRFASTSVVKATLVWDEPLGQIVSGGLAGLQVTNDLIRGLLPLAEIRHASSFNGADVDKYVLAAIIRLDEAEALDAVKPLYGSLVHGSFLQARVCIGRAQPLPV